LFLHVVVDEREVPARGSAPGQGLPAHIAATRTELSVDLIALAGFNDRLLDRGWLDTHANRYEGRSCTVRGERTYQVRRGFREKKLSEPKTWRDGLSNTAFIVANTGVRSTRSRHAG
jgi:hypothetical protein